MDTESPWGNPEELRPPCLAQPDSRAATATAAHKGPAKKNQAGAERGQATSNTATETHHSRIKIKIVDI
ncbi:hypothetical protein SAMN05216315_1042 [Nitrosospira sp. Nsp18]|nr:hypothetical protein SAMN05216315_1042 [Nitrosospira sp. Nsp18]